MSTYFIFIPISILITILLIAFLHTRRKNISKRKGDIKKRKKSFYYEMVFAIITWLLFLLSFFISSKKFFELQNYRPEHKPATAFESVLYHFDLTGIIVGLIGIFVGFLIYVVVENNDEQKTQEINEQLESLTKAANKIQQANEHEDESLQKLDRAVSDIKGHISSLIIIKTLSERLQTIEKIAKHAKEKDNDLYILTYAPNYGAYLMSNLKIIIAESKKQASELEQITHKDFYDNFLFPLFELKTNNKQGILNYIKEKNKLHFAVLRSGVLDKENPDQFKNFLEEHILKDKKIILIDQIKEREFLILPDNGSWENTFIHAVDNINEINNLSDDAKAQSLIDFLYKKDEKLIRRIEQKQLNITCLDYVPFQFYLSIPKSPDDKDCLGLVIFTNYFNIGQDNSVVSFSTENNTLCNSLKTMFQALLASQKKKDENINPIKEVFRIGTKTKIKIILKNVEVKEPQDEFTSYREVTPVADSRAKDQLLALLKENDINYTSDVKFIKITEAETFLSDSQEKDYTFLSVGLFHNSLSEKIGSMDKLGKLFQLIKRKIESGEIIEGKKIKVAIKGDLKDPQSIIYEDYVEIFNKESKKDFAIFSKQKMNGKWIFVCGGVNYFASQYIAKCLSADNCKKILKEVLPTEEFIAVYQVNNDDKITTELISLSVVDVEGKIIKKI